MAELMWLLRAHPMRAGTRFEDCSYFSSPHQWACLIRPDKTKTSHCSGAYQLPEIKELWELVSASTIDFLLYGFDSNLFGILKV